MIESIRLCGSITGPARLITAAQINLASDPSLHLSKGDIATLSTYYTHRSLTAWGPDAASYKADRFIDSDPPIGSPRFISRGLKGPHMCPGRCFGMAMIQLMVKSLLTTYRFERVLEQGDGGSEDDKYIYSAGSVSRKDFAVTVYRW